MNKALFGEPAVLFGLLGAILVAVGHVVADGIDGWSEISGVVLPLFLGFLTRQFVTPVSN